MRVISLLPSATEIVGALGGLDLLVGVTHECDHPAAVTGLPRVTSCQVDGTASPGAIDAQVREIAGSGMALYTLDEERIRALQPDLILTQALCEVCAVMETDVRALATRLSPAPRVLTLSATTLDGTLDDIGRVAGALSLVADGEELLAGLRERVRLVHATLKAARAPRPRVAVIEWTDPVFAGGHWVPEMVRRAGGTDALGRAGEHSRVATLDELREARPDVVLFAPCGYGLDRAAAEAARVLALPEWEFLASCDAWALDANGLTSRPGPRVVNGIEAMARIFNAELFSPLDPAHARRVVRPSSTSVQQPQPAAPRILA